MKAYLLTTSAIFGMITGAHVLRMYYEPGMATDLPFLLLTALSAALCVWGIRLLLRKA
jgi:hypothetical protein